MVLEIYPYLDGKSIKKVESRDRKIVCVRMNDSLN